MKRAVVTIALVYFMASSSALGQLWKKFADSAAYHKEQNEPEKALSFLLKAKQQLAKDSIGTARYSILCNEIGDLCVSLKQTGSAINHFEESIKSLELNGGKYQALYATNANSLGLLFISTDIQKAKYYFTIARTIRDSVFGKENALYATSCNNLGNLYSRMSKYDSAELVYREAMSIRARIFSTSHPDYAQSCNNLSDLLRRMGRLEEAEPLAIEAKNIREQMPPEKQHPAYAISCTNLANLYKDMGQFDKALILYMEAKSIRAPMSPAGRSTPYLESCNVLAGLYYQMGKQEEAEKEYLEIKKIWEDNGNTQRTEYAQVLNNLSLLYMDEGSFSNAESMAMKAKSIWEEISLPDDPNLAINNNLLGLIYQSEGITAKAIQYLNLARNQWKKSIGPDHPTYTQNATRLAEVYWKTGDKVKANQLFQEAFSNQYKRIRKLFRFTNELEKETFLKNINGSIDEIYSFQYSQLPTTDAGNCYEASLQNRNLILTSSIGLRQVIYSSGDSVLMKKFRQWTAVKKQLSALYAKNETSPQIRDLESIADTYEKQLMRNISNKDNNRLQLADWKAIQKRLSPSEASIEFVAFQFFNGDRWTDSVFYAALLLRKNQPGPIWISLFEESKLDSYIQSLKNSTGMGEFYTRGVKVGGQVPMGKEIYDLLWRPLEPQLRGIKKVFYAPAGILHRVSFAAIPINEQQALGEKYDLIRLNTTAAVLENRDLKLDKKDSLLLYGAINYDQARLSDSGNLKEATGNRSVPFIKRGGAAFGYLPGTKTEMDSIVQLASVAGFSTRQMTDTSATEESFKALDSDTTISLIHLATHGYYFPANENMTSDNLHKNEFQISVHPLLRSGIALAGANQTWNGEDAGSREDGILTGLEVATMYLPRTKLVILSACETALGDINGNEGVYGLQRSFKMAGVKYLIMSLWAVPDAATADYMKLLYKNLFSGMTINKAFEKAQMQMRHDHPKEPEAWAGWILVY